MDVVVTGACGFLGRHFVRALEMRGEYVRGIDVALDALVYRDALGFFRSDMNRWDLMIHCAAVSPHRAAIDGHAHLVGACNLELDAAMFHWAARTRPGRVVYLSSSAAYPVYLQTGEFNEPLREHDTWEHPGEADAIYGTVKVMGERLARLYREQGGAVTVLRPFSGYGEDQTSDFPFGAFRDRARRREDPFTIWGSGEQVRDWIHVEDVVGAVLAAVDAEVDGPLNVATGIGTSMAELAAMFCAQAGYDPTFEFLTDRPAGVAYRVGDPTLLNEVYTPRVSLAEGVKRSLAAPLINM